MFIFNLHYLSPLDTSKIIWYYKLSTDSTYKNATDTYTATTANTTRTHTFTGLTQNKTYNAYAVVYDATGRTTQSTTINVTTGTVPTASGATYTPNTWTKGNVTVTLPTKNGYSTVYTTNGTAPTKSSTKYSAAFTVSNNCKINYLYTDGTNIGGAGTVNVTNIDKLAPNAFTPKTTVTTNSIKVDGTTTDATATSTNGSSGIKEYRFSKDGGKTYTNAQTSATYTFSGLTQKVEYTIVGSTEVDLAENKISNESPLGEALLGAKKGQTVEVNAPAGIMKYKILSIKK